LATCFAFIILAEFNFIVGLSAFVIKSVQGIIRAKYFIVQLCSGLLIPISFFPQWAQSVLAYLPFQDIAYVPLQLYLGKIPADQFQWVIAKQVFWVALLFVIGRVLWRRSLNHLTLQGG
jgi:ABC-2 type transport system permease protein